MAEKEKDVLVKGRLAEGAELGTSVTYNDPNQTGQPIRMGEVSFAPGEAVDLADLIGEERAKEMAKKLANNPSFKVEGGPDHKNLAEERAKHEEEVAKKKEEADKKEREAAQRQQQYKAPDEARLEHEPRASSAKTTTPQRGSR